MSTPSLPWRYQDDDDDNAPAPSLDLTDLAEIIQQSHTTREAAYTVSREMRSRLIAVREHGMGTPQAATDLQTFLDAYPQIASGSEDRSRREANLSSVVEEYLRLCAFQHFLTTAPGSDVPLLLPPPTWATDEEYLAGAMMGLAKEELEPYGLGRATVRDTASVQAARNVTDAILQALLQFDFRNGPLRRKYDGVKYALKALETLLYELAVTTPAASEESASKKPKLETTPALLPTESLAALQHRMEERDALREQLIKHCRDGQKAAKQAIFALHRGDRSTVLLDTCRTCITDTLFPIVQQEPPLRASGSFTSVVEEYVEASLFAAWLYGRRSADEPNAEPLVRPAAVLLGWREFEDMLGFPLEPEEYLGGLSDLSGEVGRFAVQRGTARDVAGVKLCLVTNGAILREFQKMGRLPGKSGGNKMEAVRRSVGKLERMLYELSLSEAAGGRNVQTDVVMEEETK